VNKNKAAGFTLMELVIGLVLSGIIAAAVYNIFFVVNRTVDVAEPYIENDMRISLIYNRLKKDLDGFFIPTQAETKQTSTAGGQQAEKQKPAEKPIDRLFYSTNKDNRLNELSFITDNPLLVYYDPTKGTPKSAVVRVVYRLKPMGDNNFSLMRQESSNLDMAAFDPKSTKPIREYELANNIKNISMEYAFPVQEKQGTKSTEKKQPPKYETRTEWLFEEWTKKEKASAVPRVPQLVTMKLVLWNEQHNRESEFIFKFEIPTFTTSLAGRPAIAQLSTTTSVVAPQQQLSTTTTSTTVSATL
jgi:prepilin-type N-terminal cleavage/methylation domain-containing protein